MAYAERLRTLIGNFEEHNTSNKAGKFGIMSSWFSSTTARLVRTFATARQMTSLSWESRSIKSGMRFYEKKIAELKTHVVLLKI